MSIAQNDTEIKTWADLDASNSGHYQVKARPDWVVQAEAASAQADEIHNALIDRYLDGRAEWDAVNEAERYANAYYEFATDCRGSWHAGFTMPKYDLNYYFRKQDLPVVVSDHIPACYGLPD